MNRHTLETGALFNGSRYKIVREADYYILYIDDVFWSTCESVHEAYEELEEMR